MPKCPVCQTIDMLEHRMPKYGMEHFHCKTCNIDFLPCGEDLPTRLTAGKRAGRTLAEAVLDMLAVVSCAKCKKRMQAVEYERHIC